MKSEGRSSPRLASVSDYLITFLFPLTFLPIHSAPVAIMVAVAGTGLAGWVLNIAMVLASQDSLERGIDQWPGGLIFADILNNSAGKVVSIPQNFR